MDIVIAIILGAIQGLTEFIPVSSSGHLVVAQNLIIGESKHLFLEFVNIGTTLALVFYFRVRLWELCIDVFILKKYKLFRNIILTSVPAGIVGYVAADFIDSNGFFSSSVTVVVTLLVVGVIMVLLDSIPRASDIKGGGEKLTPARAVVIGLAQMVALIPGVSRSGSTIIAGRLMGLKNSYAAEYSFMASIPIMLGVSLKLFVTESDRQYLSDNISLIVISNIAAFVAGLFAIGFLLRYLSNHNLSVFGWYRISLASVLAVLLLV